MVAHLRRRGSPTTPPLGLYDNYPDELERPLIFSLMQMLWDRGEANGYAHHMTADPLREHPGPRGAAARRLRRPPGRQRDRRGRGADDRRVGLPAGARPGPPLGGRRLRPDLRHPRDPGASPSTARPSSTGTAARSTAASPDGTATPPERQRPAAPADGFGADPHSYPRNDVKARAQKGAFLSPAGTVRNPCTTTNQSRRAPPDRSRSTRGRRSPATRTATPALRRASRSTAASRPSQLRSPRTSSRRSSPRLGATMTRISRPPARPRSLATYRAATRTASRSRSDDLLVELHPPASPATT